jgi:E3 ubiquitin-protein ligase BRE1
MEEVKKKCDHLEYKAVIANAKLLKVQSQVCQYMEWQARGPSTATEDSAKPNGEAVNGSIENSVAVQAAEIAKKAAIAETKKRKEQVEALEAEKQKITEELTAATVRLKTLSDDDYASTELFKALKARYEEVIKKVNDLERLNAELREDARKLQTERTTYKSEMEKESRERCEELEAQISKHIADAQRLRQERDAKFNEKVILEQSQAKHDHTLTELRQLNAANQTRIESLESELERLRLQLGAEPNVSLDDLSDQSEDSIKKELKKYKGLYAVLEKEVESMNATVTKFRDLAAPRSEQVMRLEQEVEAVRHSRAKLQGKFLAQDQALEAKRQECTHLRQQVAKTTPVIASINEANSKHIDAAQLSERQRDEYRAEIMQLTNLNRELQQKADEARIFMDRSRQEISELNKALLAKDAAAVAAEHAQRNAEAESAGLKAEVEEAKKKAEGMAKSRVKPTEELDMLRVS